MAELCTFSRILLEISLCDSFPLSTCHPMERQQRKLEARLKKRGRRENHVLAGNS